MLRRFQLVALMVLTAFILSGCGMIGGADKGSVTKKSFGQTKYGDKVDLYTLTNANGMVVKISNYGGTIVELWLPDRNGKMEDCCLGFEDVSDYEADTNPYFGAIIGRYGNRIGKGKFTLDGKVYDKLAINNGENHLHGGIEGFNRKVWTAEPFEKDCCVGLKLHYLSKDMEEGYPGNLDCNVTYFLTNKNELVVEYVATTDKPTVCNLTNHCYFNLAGQGKRDNSTHELMLNADHYTPVDEGLITTGEIVPVAGTPMDFTKPTKIGARIDADFEQLKFGLGYDHNWVLNKKGSEMSLAASVYEPASGRYMEILTNEPGIQFYAGNFLDGTITGKEGKVYKHRYAFCLETQHYPDSPNKPEFPSTTLRPGQTYKTTTIHKFSTK